MVARFPLLLWVAAVVGCANPDPPLLGDHEIAFLRGGVLLSSPVEGGRPLGSNFFYVSRAWQAGEEVAIGAASARAPEQAECLPVYSVDLGDLSDLVAMGGEAPDTALAWSPDEGRLAVGSYRGEVLVLDGWTGEIQARRTMAETLIKQVRWSADGETLYVGEQSPDAMLYALAADTLETRWSLALSDEVGSSPLSQGEDRYAIYDLPVVSGLDLLPDGSLLVAASHGWTEDGRRRNQSRVLKLDSGGRRLAAWPSAAADATFLNFRLGRDKDLVAVTVNRSSEGPAPLDLPIFGLQVLDTDLRPVSQHVQEPLEPWFHTAFLWEAVDVSRERGVLQGFGDGRILVEDLEGEVQISLHTGTPVLAGEVPIAASVGFGFFLEDGLVYSTSGTNIPWGTAVPDLRPPQPHPNENAVWVRDREGAPHWSWSGSQDVQGLSLGADDKTLVVGAGPRHADQRRDLYGALLFDLERQDATGVERLQAVCSTEGPVFFRHAMTADGRLALAEFPFLEDGGSIHGAYRVTVMR